MNRISVCILAMAIAACPVLADETSDALALAQQAVESLAIVAVSMENELGQRTFGGQAVCIDAQQGIFMTMSLPAGLKASDIKECKLILPSREGNRVDAEFLGIDSATQLGFVKAKQAHGAKAISFKKTSQLDPGQQVVSAGLMTSMAGFPSYLGVAYVSSNLRLPDRLIQVTGGTLTGACSPVLTTDGKVVGLVGRQLFMAYQTSTQRGPVGIRLMGVDKTVFFWPVEEFAAVLSNIPTGGQASRPSWIGVGQFAGVSEEMAEVFGVEEPDQVVKIESVVPGYVGDKAGLKSGDVITQYNGQPLEVLANAALTRQNFVRQITRLSAGTEVNLTVLRSRKPIQVTVKTEPLPATPSDAPRYVNRVLGMMVRQRVPLETDMDPTAVEGLVVLGVGENSDAAQAGLRAGDVITQVNGQPVTQVEDFQKLLEPSLKAAAEGSGQWPIIKVSRGEGTLDMQLRISPRQ
ncbi:MAG: PDZ domain-containing protein [Phycisphaerae bacterium]